LPYTSSFQGDLKVLFAAFQRLAACGGGGKKEFAGDTPDPGRAATPPAPRLLNRPVKLLIRLDKEIQTDYLLQKSFPLFIYAVLVTIFDVKIVGCR
jgi:hypothetical protein